MLDCFAIIPSWAFAGFSFCHAYLFILLMAEMAEIPNNHLGSPKPCKSWDKLLYQLVIAGFLPSLHMREITRQKSPAAIRIETSTSTSCFSCWEMGGAPCPMKSRPQGIDLTPSEGKRISGQRNKMGRSTFLQVCVKKK